MKAMILAAGLGTRLWPLTRRLPKPLMEVGGKPLISHQIEWLRRAGIGEIIINLHHLGDKIVQHLADGRHLGVEIQYSHEQQLLDTGGGVVKALPLLGNAPFIYMLGDIWYPDIVFPRMLAPGSLAHLILCHAQGRRSYGDFDLMAQQVTRARSRPFIFTGIALLHPALFEHSPQGAFSMTRDLLFKRLGQGEVSGEVQTGDWVDIGSREALATLQARLQLA